MFKEIIAQEELTSRSLWDDYWMNCKIPNVIDESFSFERCLARELRKSLTSDFANKSVLEIGCAPGKWLAFFAHELGMRSFGIDYSITGIEATKKNFEALGLSIDGLHSKDFLLSEPDQQHDVVCSFGFIEHFDDPTSIISKHLKWLKPGGTLILGVPNFLGVYKPIQKILSKKILNAHNLHIMNLQYFRKIADIFKLETTKIAYLGSFEPCLFIDENHNPKLYHKLINLSLQALKRIRKLEVFDNINNKWISSYILGIYKNINE